MPRTPDSSPQTLRVFAALLEQPQEWQHGYGLSKQTGLPSGTLYPILVRLADRGLLETRWEPPTRPGRPARHAYRLTADGAVLARQRLAAPPSRATPRPTRATGTAAPAPRAAT